MKKGFTLTELLAVLILLGVVGLIVFPIVTQTIKENKENLYQSQLEEIKLAAEKWAFMNTDLLPTVDDEQITITLEQLKKAGLIGLDIRNPKTKELFSNSMLITITYKQNGYEYFVDGESGMDITSEYNENAPIMVLNGNVLEYVEYADTYTDKGAVAKDKSGNALNVTMMYQSNGVEVSSINTSTFKTYTIVYTATSGEYTSSITRTVIVRDTTPPELTIPDNIEITISEASSFGLLKDVTATDNSGETIEIETSGFDRTIGQKIVSYTACDSHENCTTKKRIINIVE